MYATTNKSERGFFALITVLIVSACLMVFVTAVGFEGHFSRSSVLESMQKERSAYLAEACINTSILRLIQNPSYKVQPFENMTVPVAEDTCRIVSITDGETPSFTRIRTQGKSGDAYTNLEAEIKKNAPEIESWTDDPDFSSAKITITKAVQNDDGGTAVASDFTFRIDGSVAQEGVAHEVSTGHHVLSEDPHFGYIMGNWGGDCSASGGITVSGGGEYTCTITNNDVNVVSNPAPTNVCGGLDIALLADVSGSISTTEFNKMKAALSSFAGGFTTDTVFSLSSFSHNATVLNNFSLTPTEAVNAINVIPKINGSTNWYAGFVKAQSTFDPRPDKMNVIIIATDGFPNVGPSPLQAAVTRANEIKQSGTRIIAIGIGDNPANLNIDNLMAVAGPNVNTGDVDVDVLTANFDTLAVHLQDLAEDLCSGGSV